MLASGAPRFRQEVPQAAASVALNWSELGPELAWSPDGWVLFGTAIANGQTLTRTEQAPPRYHRLLNQQKALVIDTGYRDGRQRELALVSRDALARPATASRGPTSRPGIASTDPASRRAPATWARTPDPAQARRQVAENLSLELPPWTGRVGYSYLPSPHAVVEGRERFVGYDLGNGLPVSEVRKQEDESKTTTSRPLCVSPNGRLFAALGLGLDVWSFDAGRSVRIPEDGNTAVHGVSSRRHAADRRHGEPRVAAVCQGVERARRNVASSNSESRPQRSRLPSALAMSPGGCYLATVETMAGLDVQLCLYEILTGRLVARATIEPGPGRASIGHWYGLAFSDDGTRLAGAWDYHGSPAIRFASLGRDYGKMPSHSGVGRSRSPVRRNADCRSAVG